MRGLGCWLRGTLSNQCLGAWGESTANWPCCAPPASTPLAGADRYLRHRHSVLPIDAKDLRSPASHCWTLEAPHGAASGPAFARDGAVNRHRHCPLHYWSRGICSYGSCCEAGKRNPRCVRSGQVRRGTEQADVGRLLDLNLGVGFQCCHQLISDSAMLDFVIVNATIVLAILTLRAICCAIYDGGFSD
jgi:hypothetical protein